MITLAFVVRTLAAYFGFDTNVRSPTSASSIPNTPLISRSPLPLKAQSRRPAMSFSFTSPTFRPRSPSATASSIKRAALRMLVYRLKNARTSTAPQVGFPHQRIDPCQSIVWLHPRLAHRFFVGCKHCRGRLHDRLSNTQSATATRWRRRRQRRIHSSVFAIHCRQEGRGRLGVREYLTDGDYVCLNSGYAHRNSSLAADR